LALPDRLGRNVDKSPYTTQDQLVKIEASAKGNHVVFGGSGSLTNPKNLLYLGKVFENTPGRSYLGANAWLDASFPHVIYITGTRGSGKSFDLGVLLEGISRLKSPSVVQYEIAAQTSILLDLQNQFWTLQFEPRASVPANARQIEALSDWGIAPNSLSDCHIFIPKRSTKLIGNEQYFTLRASDVLATEWCGLLGQTLYSPQGHIISKTLDHLAGSSYGIDSILAYMRTDANWGGVADSSRNAVIYKFADLARSELFSADGMELTDLLVPGRCNVFMLRDVSDEDKSLVTSIIARHLFRVMGDYHTKRKVSSFFDQQEGTPAKLPDRVWLFIDEAHVVAPAGRESPARDALVEYVKRGRDAGLSLVLATQQPSAIDDRILSQVNISFNHRLTFQSDIGAAVGRVPTKTLGTLKVSGSLLNDFGDMLRVLDSGQCFIGDHSTSRVVITTIRPRVTSHGGYSPA
jgi:hypothetical protein